MQKLLFNAHDIILLVTIYQCLLFVLLIFIIKKNRHQSDFFLAGFLLTQAAIPLHLLVNYGTGFRSVALNFSPDLFHLFETAYWLEGPLLLWYTRSLVYKDYRLGRIDLLFVMPAIAFLLYMLVTFYPLDTADKVELLREDNTMEAPLLQHLAGLLRECLRVGFSILCLIDIRHCRQHIRDYYSNVEDIDLGWLNFLVVAFMLIRIWAVFVSLAIIYSTRSGVNIGFGSMGLMGNYAVFVLVSALIFFSLLRSSLFEGVESQQVPLNAHEKQEVDPQLAQRVEQYMINHKPYLANILTLEQLANQLEIPPRSLSTIINRHFKQNFFEYINHFRIEEAKRQLRDPSQADKTMLEIMADCGFNSKATFNTFFKKLVGATPSQYRAEQLKEPLI